MATEELTFLLIGIIILVFVFDYITKKHKMSKNLEIEKYKYEENKRYFTKIKKIIFVVIVSLPLVLILNKYFKNQSLFDKNDHINFVKHLLNKSIHISKLEIRNDIFYLKNIEFNGIVTDGKRSFGYSKKGKKEGNWIYYFDNSKIKEKGFYTNNIKDGNFINFNEFGDTLSIGYYRNDLKNGKWIIYDRKNGHKPYKLIGQFTDGIKTGEWEEFSPENNLWGKYSFYDNGSVYTATYFFNRYSNNEYNPNPSLIMFFKKKYIDFKNYPEKNIMLNFRGDFSSDITFCGYCNKINGTKSEVDGKLILGDINNCICN